MSVENGLAGLRDAKSSPGCMRPGLLPELPKVLKQMTMPQSRSEIHVPLEEHMMSGRSLESLSRSILVTV